MELTKEQKREMRRLYKLKYSLSTIADKAGCDIDDVKALVKSEKLSRKPSGKKATETTKAFNPDQRDKKELDKRNDDIMGRIKDIEDALMGKRKMMDGETTSSLVAERNHLMVKMQSFLNSIFVNERNKNNGKKEARNDVLGW